MQAIISLGSNIGNSIQTIKQAILDIANLEEVTLLSQSSLYRTKPVGFLDQDDFINAVIAIQTDLDASSLYQKLHTLEQAYGRVRLFKNGPRTLDLDIILYGEQCIHTDELIIPHPRAKERAFVLVPLCEIQKNIVFPDLQQSAIELKEQLAFTEIESVQKI